jgi:hypothetical protein
MRLTAYFKFLLASIMFAVATPLYRFQMWQGEGDQVPGAAQSSSRRASSPG